MASIGTAITSPATSPPIAPFLIPFVISYLFADMFFVCNYISNAMSLTIDSLIVIWQMSDITPLNDNKQLNNCCKDAEALLP